MTWDEAMTFYPAVKRMAHTWAMKMSEPDQEEDLAQHLMIVLVESVDLSRCKGNVNNYVAGCLWKRSNAFFLQGKAKRWLDMLPYAINEDGEFDPSDLHFTSEIVNLMMNEDPNAAPMKTKRQLRAL